MSGSSSESTSASCSANRSFLYSSSSRAYRARSRAARSSKGFFSPGVAAFHIARALLVKSSAAKGDVKHVYVDASDPRGLVHVLFADASSANAAALALHGRWFGGRAITCSHTDPAQYNYQSLP